MQGRNKKGKNDFIGGKNMKEKKNILKWAAIYLTVFLLVTPVIVNVGGID
jgi:hypothetical protein